jgi:hypothetical protein
MAKGKAKKWHWVTGNMEKGFKIVTTKPRGWLVREPHETNEQAQRWIAMEFLMNV